MLHWKSLVFSGMLTCGVLAMESRSAAEDKKDKPALTGVWTKKEGELKIEFSDKDVLKISPHGKDEVILVLCKYTVEKGVVKARITELDGTAKAKAKDILPVGLEFSFTWNAKDNTATLADFKSDKADALKEHLEGNYEQKL